MGSQGMKISNKEKSLMLILHLNEIFDRSKIISQVQVSC
jgi:hypothetical protein